MHVATLHNAICQVSLFIPLYKPCSALYAVYIPHLAHRPKLCPGVHIFKVCERSHHLTNMVKNASTPCNTNGGKSRQARNGLLNAKKISFTEDFWKEGNALQITLHPMPMIAPPPPLRHNGPSLVQNDECSLLEGQRHGEKRERIHIVGRGGQRAACFVMCIKEN